MTIEEWLGEENQLGMDIWAKKYCCENEDFEAWLTRSAGEMRRLESISGRRNSCSGQDPFQQRTSEAEQKGDVFQLLCHYTTGR